MSERYGPNTAAVEAYLDKLAGLTPAQWDAVWEATWNAARVAAWNAAWNAARDATWAAEALVVRDLITKDEFEVLVEPMRAAGMEF